MILGKSAVLGKRAFPRQRVLHTSHGLTLLELLIAFVVLQVALVVFAQFMTKALDFSLEVRRVEMAQILAQTKMEELTRAISADPTFAASFGGDDSSRILNREPGSFPDPAYLQAEDVTPFKWLAEAKRSPDNPGIVNLTLYIYVIKTRAKPEQDSAPVRDFYVSENRERFNFMRSLGDGSIEVMSGKEKLRVSSAIALP